MRGAVHQLHFHLELFHLEREHLGQARVVDALDDFVGAVGLLFARLEQHDFVVQQVVHAAEVLAHADRPGHRRAFDLQHRFHFVEQLERVAGFAVELIHEGDDRRVAHAADVEQLDGLFFHALRGVDHHQRGVDGRQHAVRVFRKVLVARRVEQVDDVVAELELHHRRRDRDAALLLDVHPVRRRMAAALAALDGAGQLDRAGEQQQLFGERRLTGVGVGNDAEGAAARDFARDRGGRLARGDGWLLVGGDCVGFVGHGLAVGRLQNSRFYRVQRTLCEPIPVAPERAAGGRVAKCADTAEPDRRFSAAKTLL